MAASEFLLIEVSFNKFLSFFFFLNQLDLWKPDSVEDIYMDREIHVRVPSTYVQHMKENLDQQKVPFK